MCVQRYPVEKGEWMNTQKSDGHVRSPVLCMYCTYIWWRNGKIDPRSRLDRVSRVVLKMIHQKYRKNLKALKLGSKSCN